MTVFTPTDNAFTDLYLFLGDVLGRSDYTLTDIPLNLLTSVLLHHVVADRAFSFCLSDEQMIETLNGDFITVDLSNFSLKSSGGIDAELIMELLDQKASNGVIHPIKSVLVPQNVVDQLP